MAQEAEYIALRGEEAAMGFSAQTLSYSGALDLPFREGSTRWHERCVALWLDDENRVRRRHSGEGYIHERMGEGGWVVAGQFETLQDLATCPLYRAPAARESAADPPIED